ncbi:hypothetical protein [Parabacteroides pacaensis]|uniref:hypothetical protein n=1 Tax=Parabacteroides pacaensis TaxID=2086575 RepID=UPI000D0F3954|nr:hypothetical protein [Parabacteroides pacaensis]
MEGIFNIIFFVAIGFGIIQIVMIIKFMKQIALSLLFVFLLFSCLPAEKKNEGVKTLEQALTVAGNCPNAKDSLILGFNFGMDSCQTIYMVDSLVKVGKLFRENNRLKYAFNITPFCYKPVMTFTYTNDTLSKVSLVFLNEEKHPVELIKNAVTANIFKPLSNKGYKSYKEKNPFGIDDYYFIKNNTAISLNSYEHFVIMSYSNAIVDMKEKQRKDKEQTLKTQQTLSDL